MNKVIFRLFMSVLAFSLTTSAFGLEVPLTYERHPDEAESFLPGGSATLEKSLDRPAGTWKLPDLKSKQPIYGFAQLGEKKRLLVLDRQKADDFFYNRLYFDSNGNGDLTDDTAIDGTFVVENDEFCRALFPAADTTVDLGGKSLRYSFRVAVHYFYFGDDGRPDGLLTKEHIDQYLGFDLVTNCSYSGEFELNGRSYRLALADGNTNGHFNDEPSIVHVEISSCRTVLPIGDQFYLTSDEKISVYNEQPCGNLLVLDGNLFDVKISISEGKVTLTPVTENLATVRLAMAAENMTLYSQNDNDWVMMYRPGTAVMIPQGTYRSMLYTAVRKDEQGDEWFLAALETNRSPSVTVDGRTDAILKFGEPYVPMVTVPEGSRQAVSEGERQVRLMFTVSGAGNEMLAELTRVSGTRTRIPLSEESRDRPKEPTYRIMKADGEIVAQGSFEYG